MPQFSRQLERIVLGTSWGRAATFAKIAFGFSLFVALSGGQARAADWYVDSAATGNGTGASWVDAWRSPAEVVWGAAGVKGGDTLYISGGTDSKSYSDALSIGAGGTTGKPITIRIGQDPAHNGIAILPAISLNTHRFVIVDGSRKPDFIRPTSVWNIAQITNNIGIRCVNSTNVGIFASGAGGENNTVRWVEVGPIGTRNNIGDIHGIRLLNLTTLKDWLIEYCWIHDIQNDGINLNSVTENPMGWDALVVRWCLIERTGDDGVQSIRNGFTLSHSFLRDHWMELYNGHPDQLQLSGISSQYMKVVNNIFRNKANSLIISELYVTEGGTLGPMLIAGNVFYNTRDWTYNGIQAYGATFDAWRPNNDITVDRATWTGLYVLNNTVYYQSTVPFKFGRADPAGATRSVWKLEMTNSAIRNNLLVDCGYNAKQPVPLSVAGAVNSTNGVFYNTASLPMTHNIVAGANTRLSWGGTVYPSGELLNSEVGFTGNSSALPLLVATNQYDFRLTSSDTVARDNGYNLDALANQFPELMFDLSGAPRGYGNGWDIGAFEYAGTNGSGSGGSGGVITSGLLAHLTFEDSLSDGQADDSSGSGNHGIRFGHQSGLTNWPTASLYTNPVTSTESTAARFQWYPNDGWGLYSRSGDYVAITNIANGLQSMNQATVMLWVKRHPAPDGDGDGLNEWHEDQSRYISAGYGYSGAWAMGMFTDVGAPYSYLRIYTNNSASADTYIWFGEGTRVGTSRNVNEGFLAWSHLAFTWDEGAVRTYLNGTNVAEQTLPITELTVRGPSGNMVNGWIGVGVDTHNGNPWLTPNDDGGEQYPNHGWLNGEMDDVRIYNRVLSSAEIQSIFSGTERDDANKNPASPRGVRIISP